MFTDPTAFSIGPLTVQWYALFIMTGAVLGSILAGKLAEFRGLKSDAIFDIALVGIIAGVIGARLYYVMLQWDYYGQNLTQILNIPRGGLSIHGAIIFGVAAIVIMTWRMKEPVLSWLDVAAPGVAVGQAIGRWGNYANQEAFGTPTDRPWGIAIRPENRPAEYADSTHFHPTFFYEAVLNLGSAAILTFLIVRYSGQSWMRGGDILGLYLILYGIIRLPLEWIRTDSLYIGPMPAAYWLSGALILGGILIMVLNRTVFTAEKFGARAGETAEKTT
ncbi:MAG: prolipoprotein diacylglyceryl transferase [Sphaerobacteraceae bacterium]|nr:MAG: prolipoprotein diacylglyceryl transferase [Sphaerobacteraceae bacterium]